MKKPLFLAACMLAVLCLTAQKTSKPTPSLYVGQSITIEGLTLTLASNGLSVRSENDSMHFVANFSYNKCYAINPGMSIHACDLGLIRFKDTASQKVVLRLELPDGRIEKVILYLKSLPPTELSGGKAAEEPSP